MTIDCKALSNSIRADLKEKVAGMEKKPFLAVIQVGEDYASSKYVRNKEKACAEVDILTQTFRMKEDVDLATVLETIDSLNNDKNIDGILVQLPLPEHLPEDVVLSRISPDKDVDGLTPYNRAELALNGNPMAFPCTPLGIIRILDSIGFKYEGASAVVIGRSKLVGRPLASMLEQRNCTVTLCHSHTKNLIYHVQRADLIVSAVGKPEFLNSRYFDWWGGQVIIDVGINRGEDGKVTGDVSPYIQTYKSKKVTPVPGGVGLLTVTMLLENVINLAEARR